LLYLSFITNKLTFRTNPVAIVPIMTGSDLMRA
jgi:hypothetical protein